MSNDLVARRKNELIRDDQIETLNEIRSTRQKLGEFTLRDNMEAVYGEDFTKIVLGESGGNVKMKDVETTFTPGGAEGEFRYGVRNDQMRKILIEAHPDKTPAQIEQMLAAPEPKQIAQTNAQIDEAEKRADEGIAEALAKMTDEEKATLVALAKALSKGK